VIESVHVAWVVGFVPSGSLQAGARVVVVVAQQHHSSFIGQASWKWFGPFRNVSRSPGWHSDLQYHCG
jgi:hypothetical protein